MPPRTLTGFALQLSQWTTLAIQAARRNRIETIEDLATKAGVGASTIHAWKAGNGQNAEADNILAVADAAGVPRPAIDRSLRFSGATGDAPLMEALLREAGAAIGAATRLLAAEERNRVAERVRHAKRQQDVVKKKKRGEGEGEREA